MIQYFLDKLIQYYPQIAGYCVLIAIVVYLTYKLTTFYTNTTNLQKEFPDIKTLLAKIDSGLKTLNTILLDKNVINQSCYSNGNSPRVINAIGNDLLTDSGSLPLYESIKDEFLGLLEAKKFESLLELERESLNVFLTRMDDPRFVPLQNYVFQHPTFKTTPLTYTDILFLLGLKLRDLYLENHPEFNKNEQAKFPTSL
jgi:hypothetical protein